MKYQAMSETTNDAVEIYLNPANSDALRMQSHIPLTTIREALNKDARRVTFIFNNPQALSAFIQQVQLPDGIVRLRGAAPTSDDDLNVKFSQFRSMRVGVLAPISTDAPLTEWERNGDVEGPHAPNLQPVVQAWREAFRHLIDAHCIELVQFDMHCRQTIEIRKIIRLLQHVSTVMYLKRKRSTSNRSEKSLKFEVLGCSDEKKKWLKACFPRDHATVVQNS